MSAYRAISIRVAVGLRSVICPCSVVRLRGVIVIRRPIRIISITRLQACAARTTAAGPAQGHAGRERIRQFRQRGGCLGA
jgi:hypothetical protein